MKKIVLLLLPILLLAGCGTQETFETLGDIPVQSVAAKQMQVQLNFPDETVLPVIRQEGTGSLYLCDGYTLTLETASGGDLERTLREHTGFDRDALTVMETVRDGVKRWDCVWTAAGEGGDQVGRIAVLDDGQYHYVLTAMADARQAGELAQDWEYIFNSMRLIDPDSIVSTGS